MKNHPHPLLLTSFGPLPYFLPFFPLEPDPVFSGRDPSALYKLRASTLSMSCESASSPVSALNPR